jgi:hypothetical protein
MKPNERQPTFSEDLRPHSQLIWITRGAGYFNLDFLNLTIEGLTLRLEMLSVRIRQEMVQFSPGSKFGFRNAALIGMKL